MPALKGIWLCYNSSIGQNMSYTNNIVSLAVENSDIKPMCSQTNESWNTMIHIKFEYSINHRANTGTKFKDLLIKFLHCNARLHYQNLANMIGKINKPLFFRHIIAIYKDVIKI